MKNKNEIVFVLYLLFFNFSLGLDVIAPNGAFYIRSSIAITLITISVFNNPKLNFVPLIFLNGVLIIFLIDIFLRSNNYSTLYLRNFIVCGAIPFFLFLQATNYRIVLSYLCYLSLPLYFVYFLDPFFGYNFTNGYMDFGFKIALPCFCSFHIGRKIFRYKYMLFPELLAFISLFVFSNRSALLAGITFIIFLKMKTEHLNKYKIAVASFLSIGAILFFFNIRSIVEYLNSFFSEIGFYSYSLHKILNLFSDSVIKSDFIFSGRIEIWKEAWKYFLQFPLSGGGIGSFSDYYGIYPHNFILDILTSFGIFGLMLFFIFWVKPVRAILKYDNFRSIFFCYIFCSWFVPLLTSSYFLNNMNFWISAAFGFRTKRIMNYKKLYVRNEKYMDDTMVSGTYSL